MYAANSLQGITKTAVFEMQLGLPTFIKFSRVLLLGPPFRTVT